MPNDSLCCLPQAVKWPLRSRGDRATLLAKADHQLASRWSPNALLGWDAAQFLSHRCTSRRPRCSGVVGSSVSGVESSGSGHSWRQ